MRTSKTISNISYNTQDFFEEKLSDLRKAGIVEFYAWIWHHGEENEEKLEKKDHIHFLIRPAKLIQTMDLENHFKEFLTGEEKPRGVTSIWQYVNSFADWYLYCIHDSAYLEHKGKERQYFYSRNDMVTNDDLGLDRLIDMIDFSKVYEFDTWFTAAKRGISFSQAIEKGYLSPSGVKAYQYAYQSVLRDHDRILEYMNKQEKEKNKWQN